MTRNLVALGTILAAASLAGCTVKQTDVPGLSGPSALATSVSISATPDSILQDGGSQSSVVVTAIGPDGKARAGLALRLSMSVNGVAQDFGTLGARTIVTGSDGKATTVYTAPPAPPALAGGSGTTVSILASAIGSDAITSPAHSTPSVEIRLVPPGVILPPAGTPTARFTYTPTPVNFNIPVTFDGSNSCPGSLDASGNCASSGSTIASFQWTFGDGGTATGRTAAHTFVQSTTPATSFNVTLTVTNDRGVAASATQVVSVAASPAPSGDWVFSPTTPNVGESVIFNADGVRPAAGHTIVEYSWNFGDGATGSGFLATHAFSAAATYTVVLSVRDDADQKAVIPKQVTIGSGNPTAAFTAAVTTAPRTFTFDGTGSSAARGATISSYQWSFGDGTASVTSSSPITTHTYAGALSGQSVTVILTVTDSLGRTGIFSASVSVP